MQLYLKALRGATLLSAGQVSGYGLSFVRNFILARLLTKGDFGIAAALALSLSLLEMVSRMAFGMQIIQAVEGDQPEYQDVAHSVQALMGILSSLLVLLVAWPMAFVFRKPSLAWAFAAMALVPFLRGFLHLDVARYQRKLAYGRQAILDIVPQIVATLAAWPLAALLHDFRAVLWIMLGKEGMTLLLSHLLAERSYRWKWRSDYAKRIFSFGWPLLLNGLLMFFAQQGDQMIVGAGFSVEDLAVYSIAFTLTSLPWAILPQVGGSLMLPILSRHQYDREKFSLYYHRCLELSVVGSLLFIGPLIISGDPLVCFLYGAKYSGTGWLIAVFGSIVALRFLRWAPALAALSCADTSNQLLGNLARAASMPLALLLVALGTRNLELVAGCGLVGEIFSMSITLRLVRKRQGIDSRIHARPFGFLIGWIALASILRFGVGDGASIFVSMAATFGLWIAAAIVSPILLPETFSLLGRAAHFTKPAIMAGWTKKIACRLTKY